MLDSANKGEEKKYPDLTLTIDQVNEILRFLSDAPYRWASPVIEMLKTEVGKQNGAQ